MSLVIRHSSFVIRTTLPRISVRNPPLPCQNRHPMLLRERCLTLATLLLALGLRVAWLGLKPAHFDEGVNGWFVDEITRRGFYAYDPTNFHGPLHFYLLFVAQTLLGRAEWVLRLPLALIGTANVALVFAFRRHLGPAACQLAALAMAISPGAVFYARSAIHETELVFFLMLAAWGLAGLLVDGATYSGAPADSRAPAGGAAPRWAAVLGLTGAVLTKETYVLHFAAFAVGTLVVAWRKGGRLALRPWSWREAAPPAVAGLALLLFFYSGGFLHWAALPGLWLTFAPWLHTGTAGLSGHEKEWWYWLQLLGRYEWPALLGLLATPFIAWHGRAFATRGLAIASLLTLGIYSAIAYKTPWCLVALLWPWQLFFGRAVVHAWRTWDRGLAGGAAGVTLACSLALTVPLNFRRFTEETEPYVYVQTRDDMRKVLDPLRALVARDPLQIHLTGHIVMAEIHPLPWLLGDFTHLHFPDIESLPETLDAPFLLIDEALAPDIEPELRHAYFRTPLRLRGQSDGQALLYLRVAEFRDQFPTRLPEFVPAP